MSSKTAKNQRRRQNARARKAGPQAGLVFRNQQAKEIAKKTGLLKTTAGNKKGKRSNRSVYVINKNKTATTARMGRFARQGRNRLKGVRGAQGLQISNSMLNYIDTVINPFSTKKYACRPDAMILPTMIFRDAISTGAAYQTGIFSDSEMISAGYISGFLFYFIFGSTGYYGSTYTTNDIYSIWTFGVNSDGTLVGLANNPQFVEFPNYATIATATETLRPTAFAMRANPTNEFLTNSTTLGVKCYYGGQINPDQLETIYTARSAFRSYVIDNDPQNEQFSNSDGCSVRLAPCDQNLENMWSFEKWALVSNSTEGVSFPYLYIEFNQPVLGTSSSTGTHEFTLPIYFDATLLLENTLAYPSPYLATPSPFDPNYRHYCELVAVASQRGLLPLVTKGHSFKSIMSLIPKFTNWVRKGANYVDDMSAPFSEAVNITSKYWGGK